MGARGKLLVSHLSLPDITLMLLFGDVVVLRRLNVYDKAANLLL